MEPIVAGGLVLGLTVTSLVFLGLCNAVAERLNSRFFASKQGQSAPIELPRSPGKQRRSA